MPDRSEKLITLDDVTQIFGSKKSGDRPAVQNVSVGVGPGEVLCLVGESGCGKTTTARMAAGLVRPTRGSVRFDGEDIWDMPKERRTAFRRAVQYVHQDPYASLNPIRSVKNTLAIPMRRHGIATTQADASRQVDDLLRTVDLTPPESYRAKFPHQLSGGQRQRVSLARALTLEPRVLIADESTSMLDVSIRVGLLNTLTRLRTEGNVGFIFITHDLAIAKYFGWTGTTAVMYLGRIVEIGPTPQVINSPQHPYTRALLDAVPEPDPDIAANRAHVANAGLRSSQIPSLSDLPPGCSFHPRCPVWDEGRCDTVLPTLEPIDADRRVACHVVADRVEREPSPAGRP